MITAILGLDRGMDCQGSSSYRAELPGQLAVLIFATLVSATFRVYGRSINMVCDNQGVLKKICRVHWEVNLSHYKEAEADLLLTYLTWARWSHLKRKMCWI